MAENTAHPKRVSAKTRLDRFKESLKKLKAGLTTSLVLSIVIHIAMIVIGTINFRKCPASSNIPVFLIAAGVIGIVSKVLSLTRNFLLRYFNVNPILSIIGLLELVFFICGSVWVFGAFEPKYDPAYGHLYCNKTTYLFSLVLISCIYVLLFLGIFIFLCVAVGICVAVACSDDEDVEEAIPERTPLPATRE